MGAGSELYIGLMSGTSLDGVDAVLADFSTRRPVVRGATYQAFSTQLRNDMLALQAAGHDELHRAAMAANALVDVCAVAVAALLRETGTDCRDIAAIGAHGQTVRHRPADGYTWQINNPARLAEASGISVVADFRTRDVAAGGQGAPLVPAFHAALFQAPALPRVIVNIGGIANVTWLPATGSVGATEVTGWDTGPGNVLMDAWCERHLQQAFDDNGRWAATGIADPALHGALLDEPYFSLPPPKSTGRDLFNIDWLERKLYGFKTIAPQAVQATLLQLTAHSIAAAIADQCPDAREVIVCGGGARNARLMRALAGSLEERWTNATPPQVRPSDDLGVPANQVEALAFAWLARAMVQGVPGNLPAVTGARGGRVLGARYPR